ncbi:hypothetical protein ACWEVP_39840 [Amycolatopsis sp. NPDC003865]
MRAIREFFDVTLDRIAAPDMRTRLRAALTAAKVADADSLAVHFAAVNQSLAVMSRAGASRKQLRAIVDVSLSALSRALDA